jgi:hypothetical protein
MCSTRRRSRSYRLTSNAWPNARSSVNVLPRQVPTWSSPRAFAWPSIVIFPASRSGVMVGRHAVRSDAGQVIGVVKAPVFAGYYKRKIEGVIRQGHRHSPLVGPPDYACFGPDSRRRYFERGIYHFVKFNDASCGDIRGSVVSNRATPSVRYALEAWLNPAHPALADTSP